VSFVSRQSQQIVDLSGTFYVKITLRKDLRLAEQSTVAQRMSKFLVQKKNLYHTYLILTKTKTDLFLFDIQRTVHRDIFL